MLEILIVILLSCVAIVAWISNLIGLPGNWAIVVSALLCWGFGSDAERWHLTSMPLIAIVLAAVLGEVLEFAAGALGARQLGGSARGVALSIVFSIIGAMVGLAVGTGIPVIGNLIASVLGGAIGACFGSVLGERSIGKGWEHSLQVGSIAFWGRILGTLGKVFCGTISAIIFVIAVCL